MSDNLSKAQTKREMKNSVNDESMDFEYKRKRKLPNTKSGASKKKSARLSDEIEELNQEKVSSSESSVSNETDKNEDVEFEKNGSGNVDQEDEEDDVDEEDKDEDNGENDDEEDETDVSDLINSTVAFSEMMYRQKKNTSNTTYTTSHESKLTENEQNDENYDGDTENPQNELEDHQKHETINMTDASFSVDANFSVNSLKLSSDGSTMEVDQAMEIQKVIKEVVEKVSEQTETHEWMDIFFPSTLHSPSTGDLQANSKHKLQVEAQSNKASTSTSHDAIIILGSSDEDGNDERKVTEMTVPEIQILDEEDMEYSSGNKKNPNAQVTSQKKKKKKNKISGNRKSDGEIFVVKETLGKSPIYKEKTQPNKDVDINSLIKQLNNATNEWGNEHVAKNAQSELKTLNEQIATIVNDWHAKSTSQSKGK